jgi:preprotein translocase subunit SecG
MYTLIVILIIIAAALLIAAVLIQNPKGGGLGQSFGGFSNQIMGVQRTTDFLEKATWTLVISIALLSLLTVFFIDKNPSPENNKPKSQFEGIELTTPVAPQAPQAPPHPLTQQIQGSTPADTGKK